MVVPLPFFSLLADGEGGVLDGALKIILLGFLQLDNKLLASIIFAINIIDGLPVQIIEPKLFSVFECEVRDAVLLRQNGI